MIQEGMKNIAAGANSIILRRGMQKATEAAVESIKAISTPVNGKNHIAQVAAISAGDEGSRSDGCRRDGSVCPRTALLR